jgi:hypothetical protein
MVSIAIKKSRVVRTEKKSNLVWKIYFGFILFSSLILPLGLSLAAFPMAKTTLAMVLLNICIYPTIYYFSHDSHGLPAFPIFCLSYAYQFAIPILTRDPTMNLRYGVEYIKDADVISALLLSIVGMVSLYVGYFGMSAGKLPRMLPIIKLHLNEKKAVVYSIAAGLLLPFTATIYNALPEGLSKQFATIIAAFHNQVLIAIGVLGWLVYSRRVSKWHRLLLYLIVSLTVFRGVASGLLEQALIPIAVLFITIWQYRRRIPYRAISVALLLFFFLTPVKNSFRHKYWTNSEAYTDVSAPDKTFDWLGQAAEYWSNALAGNADISETTTEALYRTDLIHQFAHICSLTPSVLPYQEGRTYSYFAVAWIPRAIWPDKPEAGEANRYYAVAYGKTTEEGARRSTFGVSLLGEGYVNFGPLGVILIMALQGAFLYILYHMFAGEKSGPGGQAVFAAFFVYFINGIGTSAEIIFGNIFQFLLFSCALLWWVREKRQLR